MQAKKIKKGGRDAALILKDKRKINFPLNVR